MVSPVDKNGGAIQGFGGNFGGGVFQAAAHGGAVTYTSASSFANPQGAPGASQYLSTPRRTRLEHGERHPAGVSGGYPGDRRPAASLPALLRRPGQGAAQQRPPLPRRRTNQCPVENPPLAGSEAPAGYRNYYVRDNSDGPSARCSTSADLADLALGAEDFELAFAGATPDLATSCSRAARR